LVSTSKPADIASNIDPDGEEEPESDPEDAENPPPPDGYDNSIIPKSTSGTGIDSDTDYAYTSSCVATSESDYAVGLACDDTQGDHPPTSRRFKLPIPIDSASEFSSDFGDDDQSKPLSSPSAEISIPHSSLKQQRKVHITSDREIVQQRLAGEGSAVVEDNNIDSEDNNVEWSRRRLRVHQPAQYARIRRSYKKKSKD